MQRKKVETKASDDSVQQLAKAIDRLAAAIEKVSGVGTMGGIQVNHNGLPRCWKDDPPVRSYSYGGLFG